MTNPRIALPSKQKLDMNEIRGYKPKRRSFAEKNALLLIACAFALVAMVSTVIVPFVLPAHAEEPSAKDCMTNQCILEIVCDGTSNYTNAKEICHE